MDEELITTIKRSIRENLKDDSLAGLANDPSPKIEPMEDGYLNHVCRVTSSDGSQSCIIKKYLNYVKFLGPDVPIESTRCQREKEANNYFRSLVPNCCSLPYYCDDVNKIVCMQDLSDHRIWGESLMRNCELQTGVKIADTLVSLHSLSHREKIGEDQFASLREKFSPQPLQVTFQYDAHFVKPFLPTHRDMKPCEETVRVKMDEIIQDGVVTKAIELAREWMAVESGDCCIHGDLHIRSIMFNEENGDIKLIDTECARIGPGAFDVALLVSNYVILYHYHQEMSHKDTDKVTYDHANLRTENLDLICITLSRYMEGMSRALGDKFDKHHVWRQTLLLLGLEIIAWVSGPASLQLIDDSPHAQLNCLNTALRILHKQSLSLDTKGLSNLIHNQH